MQRGRCSSIFRESLILQFFSLEYNPVYNKVQNAVKGEFESEIFTAKIFIMQRKGVGGNESYLE